MLHAKRLDLLPIRGSHADELWPLVDDDRMWSYFPSLRPKTVGELRRRFEKWEGGSPRAGELWLNWLCRDRASDAPIGTLQATVRQPQIAYLAYAVYPAHQRKGYAREAIQAVIEHLHAAHGVSRLYVEMDAANVPSFRLAESLGFVRKTTHPPSRDLGRAAEANEYLYELRL
ncbi:MAG: GNAT family N-acetyltransferase [Candidatus Baltobacteraceae bacterium]